MSDWSFKITIVTMAEKLEETLYVYNKQYFVEVRQFC